MRAARSSSDVNTTARPCRLEERRVGGGALQDRALRRERAEERHQAAHRLHRTPSRAGPRRGRRRGRVGVEALAAASRPSPSWRRGRAAAGARAARRPMPPAAIEVLHVVRTRGLEVDEDRRRVRSAFSVASGTSMPRRPAIAVRCSDRVGRPAEREQDTQRVFHGGSVMIWRRRERASGPSRTAAAPVASAARRRSACTAGMAAVPGSMMPSASAMQAIVLAVPMTAQVPAVVARRPSTSSISRR